MYFLWIFTDLNFQELFVLKLPTINIILLVLLLYFKFYILDF